MQKYPFWSYKIYSDEELEEVDKWLRGQAQKDIVLSDNLWDNVEKISKKMGFHCHPCFNHKEEYIKMSSKDVEMKKLVSEQIKADGNTRVRGTKDEREISTNQYLRKITYLVINNYKIDAITMRFICYSLKASKIDTVK